MDGKKCVVPCVACVLGGSCFDFESEYSRFLESNNSDGSVIDFVGTQCPEAIVILQNGDYAVELGLLCMHGNVDSETVLEMIQPEVDAAYLMFARDKYGRKIIVEYV